MFTGIVQKVAKVTTGARRNGSLFLTIAKPKGWKLKNGDSVAVNGVCLTVRGVRGKIFEAELMPETLAHTSFKNKVPLAVNLERPLTLQSPLDGHLVLGHVDTTGKIVLIQKKGRAKIFTIQFPKQFKKLVVHKGSVAIDGVSLTIAGVAKNKFSVSLVAYTLEQTTFGQKKIGDLVNLEFDIIGKYAKR